VFFNYPGQPYAKGLKDVSFVVEAGTTTGTARRISHSHIWNNLVAIIISAQPSWVTLEQGMDDLRRFVRLL
jgi:hypothetical protein